MWGFVTTSYTTVAYIWWDAKTFPPRVRLDALAVEFGFKDRDVCIFTRADMFKKAPIRWVLRSFNLLPAFRFNQDGLDTVAFNEKLFKIAGKDLMKGNAVLIFPEAVNQDKRWLGNFSEGYLRMAFDTVEADGFKTDIKILPIVNPRGRDAQNRRAVVVEGLL